MQYWGEYTLKKRKEKEKKTKTSERGVIKNNNDPLFHCFGLHRM